MLESINFAQISYLNSLKLTLSNLKYLEVLSEGGDVPEDKYLRQLEKVGMVMEGEITEYGRKVLKDVKEVRGEVNLKKKLEPKKYSEEFEQWWSTFPASDNFSEDGVDFVGVRTLRSKKDECSVKYEKLAKEMSSVILLQCLRYEVDSRKDQSVVRGENLLTFMKGTVSYLNSRGFEPYINLIKNGPYKSKSKKVKRIINSI